MSLDKSNYLRGKTIEHNTGVRAFTMPTTLYVALYSTDPTASDAGTEIAGSGYARQAVTFDNQTGGTTENTSAVVFPAATADYPAEVTHIGIRDALTAGNLLYFGPATDTPLLTCSAAASTDTLTSVAHGLVNTNRVYIDNAIGAVGATVRGIYYVVGKTTDTFQISTTSGGSAADLTTDGMVQVRRALPALVLYKNVYTLPAAALQASER